MRQYNKGMKRQPTSSRIEPVAEKNDSFIEERRNGIFRSSQTRKIDTICEVCNMSTGLYQCRICNKILCAHDVVMKNYCIGCFDDKSNRSIISAIETGNPHSGCYGYFYNLWYTRMKKNRLDCEFRKINPLA